MPSGIITASRILTKRKRSLIGPESESDVIVISDSPDDKPQNNEPPTKQKRTEQGKTEKTEYVERLVPLPDNNEVPTTILPQSRGPLKSGKIGVRVQTDSDVCIEGEESRDESPSEDNVSGL